MSDKLIVDTTGKEIKTEAGDLNLSPAGDLVVTSPTVIPTGTSLAPSLRFANDSNTGLYSDSANIIRFSCNGVNKFEVSTSYVEAHTNVEINSNKLYNFVTGNYAHWNRNLAISSGAVSVSNQYSNCWECTLTENITSWSFSNLIANSANSVTIKFTQDATGGRTVTWPASFKWPGGEAPTVTPDANAIDLLLMTTYDGGTTWLCNLVQDYK